MSSELFRIPAPPSRHGGSRAERLRAAGLKATAPRLAILRLLEADRTHPSAQAVLDALKPEYPTLSLSTVYETLEAFLRAGLCRPVAGEGALLRVDGTTHAHDHAVCRQCGRIFDVASRLRPPLKPPSSLPGGLAVTGVRVEYEVVCGRCAGGRGARATHRTEAGNRRAGAGAAGRPRNPKR
jgi:Fur family peroxide stress response transcriptional regulator